MEYKNFRYLPFENGPTGVYFDSEKTINNGTVFADLTKI